MARRPMRDDPRPEPRGSGRVERVAHDSRALVTDDLESKHLAPSRGAIVRIKPKGPVDREQIEASRRTWLEAGAVKVVVVSPPSPKTVPGELLATHRPVASARQAALDLAMEANSEDPKALLELVEQTLDVEGV